MRAKTIAARFPGVAALISVLACAMLLASAIAAPTFASADEPAPASGGLTVQDSDAGAADARPMHRLYNQWSGEHFYTSDDAEHAGLVDLGWTDEGTGWTAPGKSETPVYRMYNPYAGEHHYTMDASEKDSMIAAGWVDEEIGWYSDDAQGVPLFREYNPNEFANNHNYTVSVEEHESLMAAGWRDEGYAWYGLASSAAAGEGANQEESAAQEEGAAPEGPEAPAPEDASQDNPAADDSAQEQPAEEEPAANIRHATVKVQGYDEFVIDVDFDSAPITAANFCKLVEDGYYDGLVFYRIQEGFCLQGGSWVSDSELDPIVGEFSENGYENPLADDFRKGTVAMARTGEPDSATSEFFVTLATSWLVSNSLNGRYAAFGTIDEEGMKVVDAICADYAEYTAGDMGFIYDPDHMPVIESITMAE